MAKPVKQMDRHVESILAAADVLDCFLENPKCSLKQIIDATQMTRNRVTRILGTLLHRGYVMVGEESGVFTPGPKLKALGNVFEDNQNLVFLARRVLRELALKTGESATFYVREGLERVVLAREEGTDAIRFSVAVGQRMDLHAGSAGKVLLAFTAETERDIILQGLDLKPITDKTQTDPGGLAKELDKIRKQGFGVSRGERNPDAFSVAAPVFERKNKLAGALAIAGPISRLTAENRAIYKVDLIEAATALSKQFGWT